MANVTELKQQLDAANLQIKELKFLYVHEQTLLNAAVHQIGILLPRAEGAERNLANIRRVIEDEHRTQSTVQGNESERDKLLLSGRIDGLRFALDALADIEQPQSAELERKLNTLVGFIKSIPDTKVNVFDHASAMTALSDLCHRSREALAGIGQPSDPDLATGSADDLIPDSVVAVIAKQVKAMTVDDLVARLRVPVPPIPQKKGGNKHQNRRLYLGAGGGYYLTYSPLDQSPQIPQAVVQEALKLGLLAPTYPDSQTVASWDLAELVERDAAMQSESARTS